MLRLPARTQSPEPLGASVTDDRAKNKLTEEIQPTLPDSLKKTS